MNRLLIAAIVAWSAVVSVFAAEPPEGFQDRIVNAYWTDAPPVIDGRGDDPCWQQADVTGDFKVFKLLTPPQKGTEVRVCYDAVNIYLLYTLFEPEMAQLAKGAADDARDVAGVHGDAIELFLDPGRTREVYYQLMVNPNGGRYDARGYMGTAWNPDWTARTSLGTDRWLVEIAIPFEVLTPLGVWAGTPQPGDVWGALFCRDQSTLKEWSAWMPMKRGYHSPTEFGGIAFKGRRQGPALPVVKAEAAKLTYGAGACKLTITGGKLSGWYSVSHKPAAPQRHDLPAASSAEVTWSVPDGGKWDVRVRLSQGDRLIYAGGAGNDLPLVGAELKQMADGLTAAEKLIATFEHPAAAGLKQRAAAFRQHLQPALDRIAKPDQLDEAGWQALIAAVGELRQEWRAVAFDRYRMQLYSKGKARPFGVGLIGPDAKVYPQEPCAVDPAGNIEVSAAGRESESAQLVVVPFWQEQAAVQVTFTDLTGAGATIPASNLTWRLVDYVKMPDKRDGYQSGYKPEDPNAHHWEPDILMPAKPFKLAADRQSVVWVDVYCPPGTPRGEYKGTVTIAAGDYRVSRSVTLNAWGFDLPETAKLLNAHWFHVGYLSDFYGGFGEEGYSLALYEKHARLLSRYRVTPYLDDWRILWNQKLLPVYREADGSVTYDFSIWEQYLQLGRKYGGNLFSASLSCNMAAAAYLANGSFPVTDRETGKQLRLRDCYPEWKPLPNPNPSAIGAALIGKPMYADYMRQYVAFLKRIGILEHSYYEVCDESHPTDMIPIHRYLQDIVPELPLMDYGVDPTKSRLRVKGLGYENRWAPNLGAFDNPDFPGMLEKMRKRRIEYGEKYHFYVCGNHQDGDGNYAPFIQYYEPYIAQRMLHWMAWKYQADGLLIFMMFSGSGPNKHADPADRWPNVPWQANSPCQLLYPGPGYELYPSMRLTNIRDGMEDYDYFYLLHRLTAYLDEDNPQQKALLDRARQELVIPETICKSPKEWTKDAGLLLAKRERIARLIQEIRDWRASYPESVFETR